MSSKKRRSNSKHSMHPQPVIFDVVDTFDELAPRLQELLAMAPAGTRVYVRVKSESERGTVH